MNNPPTGGPNMANYMWQLKNKTIIHMKLNCVAPFLTLLGTITQPKKMRVFALCPALIYCLRVVYRVSSVVSKMV